MNTEWRFASVALFALLATTPVSSSAQTYADVATILAARCTICHSGSAAPNGVALDNHASILKGGKNGLVVKPGAARDSELVKRIRGERQPRMPLTGPPFLADSEIALIEAWIEAGAPAGRKSVV